MTGDEYILFYQKGPNMKTTLSSGEKKYKQKQYLRYILFVVYGMQLQGGFFWALVKYALHHPPPAQA